MTFENLAAVTRSLQQVLRKVLYSLQPQQSSGPLPPSPAIAVPRSFLQDHYEAKSLAGYQLEQLTGPWLPVFQLSHISSIELALAQ